jgi:hypothetical protein
MIDLKIEVDEFILRAQQLGATIDQIPYILARSLNDGAEKTRTVLIEDTWPSSVQARNRSFIGAALTTKGARATKETLEVQIYDRLGRANLLLHAKGGTRRAEGGNIAVPSSRNVTRTARGAVRPTQLPKNLQRSFKRGRFIFQEVGRRSKKAGSVQRLRLMYTLTPNVPIKLDVPFYRDFAETMRQAMREAIPKNVEIAMRTKR